MTKTTEWIGATHLAQQIATLLSEPRTVTDLHLWRASLASSPQSLAHFSALLSSDEKARAARFHFERDRARYTMGRGILRTLLGSYLGLEPENVKISYGPQGKPFVDSINQNQNLEFNVSHSNEHAVYLFGWDRLVGIDIEHIRPMTDADDFAKHFFSKRESLLIRSLSGNKKWEAFFKFWTCKEAYLKANGSGLTVPLNEVEIALENDGSAALTSIGGDTHQAQHWRLETFNPTADYQVALLVEGQNGNIIHQNLTNLLV
jgi:Phosphopantetheinyl transferase